MEQKTIVNNILRKHQMKSKNPDYIAFDLLKGDILAHDSPESIATDVDFWLEESKKTQENFSEKLDKC